MNKNISESFEFFKALQKSCNYELFKVNFWGLVSDPEWSPTRLRPRGDSVPAGRVSDPEGHPTRRGI